MVYRHITQIQAPLFGDIARIPGVVVALAVHQDTVPAAPGGHQQAAGHSLATEIAELEKAVSNYDQGKKLAEKFIALIDKYQGFENMTNTMLNEFVEKILVHERDRKGSIETTQAVEVYFNFVGKYIPPAFREVELTREEQEAIRKNEELKDKRHQAYLRRKASGWQRQYEERTRPGKKAKIDAQKAAIRQEDMAKGIYAHVADLPRQEPKRAAIQVRPTL